METTLHTDDTSHSCRHFYKYLNPHLCNNPYSASGSIEAWQYTNYRKSFNVKAQTCCSLSQRWGDMAS
jgi:GDP-D-mannose dehydratase